ncbi:MAG TPA: DUF4926 domain-containing protein [Deinococcales bacterium]|nr:DUF4926 domain-containing protein [Deinococcales bacterium]
MPELLESVALTVHVPAHGLLVGDVGTVVFVHGSGEAYEVEFVTYSGETVAVLTLNAAEVRSLGSREIANARRLGPPRG